MSLEHALRALPDDPLTALRDLLLEWQARRAPEVADLVERLGTRLGAGRPPLDGKPADEDAAWQAVARKRDPLDVPRLLAAPAHPNPWREEQRTEWIEKHFRDDARLSTALITRLAARPGQSQDYWWRAVRRFKRLMDPRAVLVLRAAAAKAPQRLRAKVVEAAEHIARGTAKLAPLDAGEKTMVRTLAKAIQALPKGTPAPAPATAKPPRKSRGGAKATFDGSPEEVLAVAVERWRGQKHPALAELIARLGARVERPALAVKPVAAALGAWIDCERAHDPVDVTRLAAALRVGTVKQIIERLEVWTASAAAHADPRLADAAMAILIDQPFTSGATRPLYTAATRLLDAVADPRTAARLDELEKTRMPGLGADGGVDFRDFFAGRVERAQAAARNVAKPAELAADERAAIDTAIAKLGATRKEAAGAAEEAAFLNAIWATPADDEPRRVYGDWLQEQGRPHGELIALQLARGEAKPAGAAGKREKELIAQHWQELLGPLAPAIQKKNVTFERGFVVHAEIPDKRSPLITDLATHPAWGTLKSFYAWDVARRLYPELMAHLKQLGARSLRRR